ncbi:FGGY-family carbohydrate kinase [Candidatus Poribacteria bacterium]
MTKSFELQLNLKTLAEAAGVKIERLRAVGGGAKSKTWLQPKADMTVKEVVSLAVPECGCLGAAILAGVGVNDYSSVDEAVELLVAEVDLFQPNMDMHEQYAGRFAIYSELYPALKDVTRKM